MPSEVFEQETSLEPVDLQWVQKEVVVACGGAMRRLRDRPGSTLAITSAVRGEGRTTIALAMALAQRNFLGRKTVLLDLDLDLEAGSRHPPLAERAGLAPALGLAALLRGEANLQDCLAWPAKHLGVLPAGDISDSPPTISRAAVNSLLNELRQAGFFVVADLPPIVIDGLGERLVDLFATALLVVRAGTTPVDAVRAAAATLAEPPLVLLNRKNSAVPRWLRPLGS